MNNLKEDWIYQMKSRGFKYFVLKAEDFLESLTESEILEFNDFLITYNEYRKPKPINTYFIIDRDDYTFENTEEFLKAIDNYKINKNE